MPNEFNDPLIIMYPPFQKLETMDFPAKDQSQITDPHSTNPLVEGEWITVLGGSDTGKIKRTNSDDPHPMLYLGQIGRTDIQMSRLGPVAIEAPIIIKTKLVDGSNNLTIGDDVMVGNVTYDGKTRVGLLKATTGKYAVGKVMVKGKNTGNPDGSYWEIFLYRQPFKVA